MKILLVVGSFPALSETFIFRKVVALAQRGHQVIVAVRDPGDWQLYEDQLPLPSNVKVVYLTPDSRLYQPSRLWRVVKNILPISLKYPLPLFRLLRCCSRQTDRWREIARMFLRYSAFVGIEVDVMHFEFLGLAGTYRMLPELLYAPYVVSCRGSDTHLYHQHSHENQAAIIVTLLTAAAVHVVSAEMKDVVKQISLRENGVWINRPAVQVDRISPKADSSVVDIPLILATGRLVWKKGFDYLLAAFVRLKAHGIKFQAKILGGGDLEHALRFSICDLELSDYVDLVGSVSPQLVFEHMSRSDIFVLSSHEEGISNAVLEAMAFGLPIVTTNAGGMSEAVRDGIDGFVVPVRDIDALGDRIERLLLDPSLREQMGKAAREHVEREFSIDRQASVFEEMYESITSND